MPDDVKNRGPADRKRINVHEPWELRWWCHELNVTPERLRALVEKTGVMVIDVRRALQE
jgi:hypothetical protein